MAGSGVRFYGGEHDTIYPQNYAGECALPDGCVLIARRNVYTMCWEYQHGPNPEHLLVLPDYIAREQYETQWVVVADWIGRVHDYEAQRCER